MSKPTDNTTSDLDFWQALEDDSPMSEPKVASNVIDLTADLSELSPDEREQRRKALRSMLTATEARQQYVLRHRLPALTPGLVVAIKSGNYKLRRGRVVDADYIHSRALLTIDGVSEAQWVAFAKLGPLIVNEQAGTHKKPR